MPGGHEARYVNAKAAVSVVTKERTLTFTHGDETLQCFLFSDALPGDAPQAQGPTDMTQPPNDPSTGETDPARGAHVVVGPVAARRCWA